MYVQARVKLIKNKIFYKIHGSWFIATMFFMINTALLLHVYNKLRLLDNWVYKKSLKKIHSYSSNLELNLSFTYLCTVHTTKRTGITHLKIYSNEVNQTHREHMWDSRIATCCWPGREYTGPRSDRPRWHSPPPYSSCPCSLPYSYSCSHLRSSDRWHHSHRGSPPYIHRSLSHSPGLVCYRKVYYCIVSLHIRKLHTLTVF